MLELNSSFLIQLVNFLVLLFFLSHFLFKPVLKMVEKRNQMLDTHRTEAENLNKRAEKIFAEYNAKTSNLKKENTAVLAASRQQGIAEQERIVNEARETYEKNLESGLAEVERVIAKVRTDLRSEAQKLSHKMASILAGRTV